MPDAPLWTPSQTRSRTAALSRFIAVVESHAGRPLQSYRDIHRFSVDEPELFWTQLWDFCGVIAETRGQRVLAEAREMAQQRFFPDARLNYAENLLRQQGRQPAILFRGEDRVKLAMNWDELRHEVALMAAAYRAAGIAAGDRVCAVVPNHPRAVIAFLAASAVGAIWSSCSPDFGERGILDRFGQIAPRLLVTCDGYFYGGKTHSLAEKIAAVAKQLPSLEKTVIFDYAGDVKAAVSSVPGSMTWDDFCAAAPNPAPSFERLPFDHPLYILYSSGTTGIPKCIVHGAGGILLKHLSEHVLNTGTGPEDRLFYFTTCGWMMWNWLVSGLAAGATLLLYDGSPFHPSERALFDFAEEEAMTIFGTSAKFIDAVRKSGFRPRKSHALEPLRSILSTGSPLTPDGFAFVYDSVKADVQLASISGGTDICGCFVGGNPLDPVWSGEIQGPMLGMAVDVFDPSGRPMAAGKGELVCTRPFPSMPVMFWNDPDGRKYRDAYFSRFPGIWCHGDFAEWTPHGGMVIHGRSDATLNPGGVRIGTAEIYAQVERVPEVIEALAIGQEWDNDVRIVLFVRLRPGTMLDVELERRIRAEIRAGASPRHVPQKIVAVADIPRTKSGKITELAVRDIVHGREVANREALANPEALDLFRDLAALRS